MVLEFGSATEPKFRARVKAVNELVKRYAGKATFVIVYAKEAHAADSAAALDLNTDEGFSFAGPTNLTERIGLAKQTAERLHIDPALIAVDQWNNFSSDSYGGYPNMTFLIDSKGILQAGYAWMDTTRVQKALDELIVGRPVPPDLRGRTEPGGPNTAATDVVDMSMEMGGRGPQAVGTVLDHLSLTDAQKAVVYPALAQFYTDLRDIRQLQANVQVPNAGGARAGAPAQPAAQSSTPAVTPEELQKALDSIRSSAHTLDTVCKANLSDADYHKIMDIIEEGPQIRRFFDADALPMGGRMGRRGN